LPRGRFGRVPWAISRSTPATYRTRRHVHRGSSPAQQGRKARSRLRDLCSDGSPSVERERKTTA
jgi:hypothetical protein